MPTRIECIQELRGKLRREHGILAAARFRHAVALYWQTGREATCCVKDAGISGVWQDAKRILDDEPVERGDNDTGYAGFVRLIDNGIDASERIRDEEYLKSVRRLVEDSASSTIDMGAFRWLWEEYGDSFRADRYDSHLASSPFWDSYGSFISLVCGQISHMDESDKRLSSILDPEESDCQHLSDFDSKVRACIELAARHGRHFEFNEMAGLYSLLCLSGRTRDYKLWRRTYRAMYDVDPGPDLSWLDDYV